MKNILTLFLAMALSTVAMAQPQPGDWLTVSLDSTATIDFPVQPQSMPAMGRTMFTVRHLDHVYTALVSPTTYQNNINDSAGVQNTYKLFISGVKMSVPGTEVVSESDFSYRGFPGKEYVLTGSMKGSVVWMATRIVIIDGQQYAYVFTCLNTNDLQSPDKTRFFNSLNLGGHANATGIPMPGSGLPKFNTEEYLFYAEVFGAIIGGVFAFILIAVGVQTLLKKKKAA